MKEKNDEEAVLKGLSTMLPTQLHDELTNYCKGYSDSFGKWSYTVGFKTLLQAAKVLDALCELENRVTALEIALEEKPEEPENKETIKTLGGDLNG